MTRSVGCSTPISYPASLHGLRYTLRPGVTEFSDSSNLLAKKERKDGQMRGDGEGDGENEKVMK